MKHFEYVWLASAGFLFLFLVFEYESLRPFNYFVILGGILVSSFMYSFRRRSRLKYEKQREAEMQQIEKELEDPSH